MLKGNIDLYAKFKTVDNGRMPKRKKQPATTEQILDDQEAIEAQKHGPVSGRFNEAGKVENVGFAQSASEMGQSLADAKARNKELDGMYPFEKDQLMNVPPPVKRTGLDDGPPLPKHKLVKHPDIPPVDFNPPEPVKAAAVKNSPFETAFYDLFDRVHSSGSKDLLLAISKVVSDYGY